MCVANAVKKLDKYLELTRESPAWIASVVLHPCRKWTSFTSLWKNTAINRLIKAKAAVRELWVRDYKPTDTQIAMQTPAPHKVRRFDVGNFHSLTKPEDVYQHEYEKYISEKPDYIDNPIQWWKDREVIFPNLSRFALDMLTIPAMSSESERVFSKAGYSLAPRRSGLEADILEASECLRSWLTKGVVVLNETPELI